MSWCIPPKWTPAKLGEVLEVIRGVSYQKGDAREFPEEGLLPILRANNIQDGKLILDDLVYVPESYVSDIQRLHDGDIVIAASSGSRKIVGKAAPVLGEWNGSFGAFCYGLRPIGEISPSFLNYHLQSREYRRQVSELSAGININNLRREHIEGMGLPLPPLSEQRRIVAKLDALFERSRNIRYKLDRIPTLLDKLRKSIFAAALSGRLSREFRGSNELVSWAFERAADVCAKVQSGSTPKQGFLETGEIPFLKVYNIVGQKVDFRYRPQYVHPDVHRGSLGRSVVYPGDVLMNIVGPPLGKVAVVPDDFPEWNINQAITVFRPSDRVTSGWLYLYLCGGAGIEKIVHETKGIVGQVNISLSQCRDFVIPVPPVEEQNEVVRIANELLRLVEQLERLVSGEAARIGAFENSTLEKAFRGEFVPQDPNDEPASTLLERIRAARDVHPATRRTRKTKTTTRTA